MGFVERNYENNSQQKILVEKNIMLPHSCARILFHFMYNVHIYLPKCIFALMLLWSCCDHALWQSSNTMAIGHQKDCTLEKHVSMVRINWDEAKLAFVKVLLWRPIFPLPLSNTNLNQSWNNPLMQRWNSGLTNSGVVWDSTLTFVNVNTLTIHQVSNSNLNSLNPTSWVRFWNKPFDFSHISKHPFVCYLLSWSIKNQCGAGCSGRQRARPPPPD